MIDDNIEKSSGPRRYGAIVQRLVSPSGDQIVLMIVNTVGITMEGRQVIYKKPEPGHDIDQIRASRMLALMRRE